MSEPILQRQGCCGKTLIKMSSTLLIQTLDSENVVDCQLQYAYYLIGFRDFASSSICLLSRHDENILLICQFNTAVFQCSSSEPTAASLSKVFIAIMQQGCMLMLSLKHDNIKFLACSCKYFYYYQLTINKGMFYNTATLLFSNIPRIYLRLNHLSG